MELFIKELEQVAQGIDTCPRQLARILLRFYKVRSLFSWHGFEDHLIAYLKEPNS